MTLSKKDFLQKGEPMNKETIEILNYKKTDIQEGIQNLINGELNEEQFSILKNDLVKQLQELKEIIEKL